MTRLLIDALYINNSGGRTLLNYLVEKLKPFYSNTFFLLDDRCRPDFDFLPNSSYQYLSASLSSRKKFYKKNAHKYDKIFCLANLAPPLKIQNAIVYTYFHNVLYLDEPKWNNVTNIKKALKQVIFKKYLNHTNEVWVQTSNVKEDFLLKYDKVHVRILPFFDLEPHAEPTNKDRNIFLYVSTGAPHKNHKRLVMAWEKVNNKYPKWELHLTLSNDKFSKVLNSLNLSTGDVNIINHGVLSKSDLNQLYSKCATIIYPSLKESFGLSLIEGASWGCNIIASDLPYVNAVIEPTGTFNPYAVEDIAQKIVNLGNDFSNETPKIKVENHINEILNIFFAI